MGVWIIKSSSKIYYIFVMVIFGIGKIFFDVYLS